MRPRAWALATALLLAAPALAVLPDERMADAAQEARARALSAELRCVVCQNQSIDDSDAPLARDLRLIVRERIRAGDSDDEVKAWLVERYGSYVLLRPPFDAATWALWLGPAALLMGGGGALWWASRRRRLLSVDTPPLSAEEALAVERLLAERQP